MGRASVNVYTLELATYPLIARMMQIGILPDLEHYAQLSERLAIELECIQAVLEDQTGRPGFNANSYLQVGDVLFNQHGLEPIKLTDTGDPSTNDKILEALEHAHGIQVPVLSTIRSYREVYKLKSTFVDVVPSLVHRWPYDSRIHATFRTTRVVTGRLAASDPNILALPKHGKFAKDFRQGLICEPGHVLGEWDLSQIELRMLAHLSQDPIMLAIFRGEMRNRDGTTIDLHSALAERIFGIVPSKQDKSKHRLPVKVINFGLPMGMQAQGLCLELRKNGLDVDEDDAQCWIDETMGLYKGVPVYQQDCIAEARRNGYVRCLSGRVRYIGGINASHEAARSEAERFAYSTKIQEGAQWIMKQAEARIWNDLLVPSWRQGHWIEPLMQVHDAMNIEMDVNMAQDVHQIMAQIMVIPPNGFSVPIETSGDFGPNLADLREF